MDVSASDDPHKTLGLPIYDEYEDYSLDQDFVNQRENGQGKGNTLPLCFEAFELIKRGYQVVSQGHSSGPIFSEVVGSGEDLNSNFENSGMGNIDIELTYDEYPLKSENNEEESSYASTLECVVLSRDPIFLCNPKAEFPSGKGQIPFEQEEEFLIDEGPEYMRFLFDLHANENEEDDDTMLCVSGQKEVIGAGSISLVFNQQMEFPHILHNPFATLL